MNRTNEIAADALRSSRPGVPEKKRVPAPVGHAHWLEPDQQAGSDGILVEPSRHGPTATFGTGPLPRGLSGLLRKGAYRIPDYQAKRWALLLLADRVDSLEDRLQRVVSNPASWLVGAAVGLGVWRIAKKK